ncbi:conjugal transfer protein TraC [Phyllobacterium sp. CCNWLW109]|uniref:conjugal transfer protein TraC n=1 Tax=Phyllobacterium sp. CCNWLW109 TaxID=3127479 RepID=UPI003076FC0B
MKKPSAKIRQEIALLQDQLRQAETREAERIGRLALKAGIGDIAIDETELLRAFEELAARFRPDRNGSAEGKKPAGSSAASGSLPLASDAIKNSAGEA